MTKRSVETLYRKLRAIEQDAADKLSLIIEGRGETSRVLLRRLPFQMWSVAFESVLVNTIEDAVTIGSDMLRKFTEENSFGAGRDLRAVGANLGLSVEEAIESWNPFGWQVGALDVLDRWGLLMMQEFIVELGKQEKLALLDDDPDDSYIDRVLGVGKVGRSGRGGMSVLYSIGSAHSGVMTTIGWQMVNEQRSDLFARLPTDA